MATGICCCCAAAERRAAAQLIDLVGDFDRVSVFQLDDLDAWALFCILLQILLELLNDLQRQLEVRLIVGGDDDRAELVEGTGRYRATRADEIERPADYLGRDRVAAFSPERERSPATERLPADRCRRQGERGRAFAWNWGEAAIRLASA